LAIHNSVKHFWNFFYDRLFSVLTDHQLLVHLATLHNTSPRRLSQTTFLSEFDFSISHLSGRENIADFLSQPHLSAIFRRNIFSDSQLSEHSLHPDQVALFLNTPKPFRGYFIDNSIPENPGPILHESLRWAAFVTFLTPPRYLRYIPTFTHPLCVATTAKGRKTNECIECQSHQITSTQNLQLCTFLPVIVLKYCISIQSVHYLSLKVKLTFWQWSIEKRVGPRLYHSPTSQLLMSPIVTFKLGNLVMLFPITSSQTKACNLKAQSLRSYPPLLT